MWQDMVRHHAKALSGLRLGELPDLVEYREEFLNRLNFSPEPSLEDKRFPVGIIIGAGGGHGPLQAGLPDYQRVGRAFPGDAGRRVDIPFFLMDDLHSAQYQVAIEFKDAP